MTTVQLSRSLTTASLHRDERRRLLAGIAMIVLSLLGAGGFLLTYGFSQASTFKYAITIAGPLLAAVAVMSREPLRVLVSTLVIAAPFAGYGATVHGLHVEIVLLLTLCAVFVAALSGPVATRPRTLAITSWWIAGAVATLVISSKTPMHYASLILTVGLIVWAAARLAETVGGASLILVSTVTSGALQGVVALWEYLFRAGVVLYNGTGEDATYGASYYYRYGDSFRPSGIFADPISLGNFLAFALPLALLYFLRAKRVTHFLLSGAALALITAGLVLSLSRMSWIGGLVGMVAMVIVARRQLDLQAIRRLSVFAAIGALTVIAWAGPAFFQRLDSVTDPTNSAVITAQTDRQRMQYWAAAADVALHHPVSGVGFGGLNSELTTRAAGVEAQTHAHSTYLQFAAEGGMIGAAILAAWVIWTSRRLRVVIRTNSMLVGLVGSCVALFFVMTTDFVIRYLDVLASLAPAFGVLVTAKSDGTDVVAH